MNTERVLEHLLEPRRDDVKLCHLDLQASLADVVEP